MKPFKTYDAATELAIEERIRNLFASDPAWVNGRFGEAGLLGRAYLTHPDPICFVAGILVGSLACEGDMPVDEVAIERMQLRLQHARNETLKANRKLRGTTTKELKAEVAEQYAF